MNEAETKIPLTTEERKEKRREYQRLYSARYYKSHPKKDRSAYMKMYDANHPDDKTKRKELDAIRYAKNRTQILAKNAEFHRMKKEEIAARKKIWRSENIGVIQPREESYRKSERGKIANNACKRRRHAQKFGCEWRATPSEILALKERSTHCYYCRKPREIIKLTVDHYMPLALGGAHAITNLVICCKSCNSRKSKLTPEQWGARSGFVFDPPGQECGLHC